MDTKLYVERWLLILKAAAQSAGLQAHVRALDFKGGRWLAFEVRKGDAALELRFRKRRTGARRLVVATGAEIVGRVREVHARLLAEHRGLLENGLRRFLRRSLALLEALESAFLRDVDLPSRLQAALHEVKEASGARPAALARRRALPRRYEILPAAAFSQASATRFFGVSERRLVDLADLLMGKKERALLRQRPKAEASADFEVVPEGIELLFLAVPPVPSLPLGPGGASPAVVPDMLPEVPADAGGLPAEGVLEVGGAAAEAVAGVADVTGEALTSAGGAAAEVVGASTGAAVEAVAQAGSCLSDAACAGFDCGGLDCLPF
ncbi:MAG: hypothetical protein L0Z62_24035 [Gemmataceae bacterium]|nr:hypothetical protein [Gemmataceae bacterium]